MILSNIFIVYNEYKVLIDNWSLCRSELLLLKEDYLYV